MKTEQPNNASIYQNGLFAGVYYKQKLCDLAR